MTALASDRQSLEPGSLAASVESVMFGGGSTAQWILAMSTDVSSYFISGYLPQATQTMSYLEFAVPMRMLSTPTDVSATIMVEFNNGDITPSNTTLEVPLSSVFKGSELNSVSTLYLTGARGVSLQSITCIPYLYNDAEGPHLTSTKPSIIGQDDEVVRLNSIFCVTKETVAGDSGTYFASATSPTAPSGVLPSSAATSTQKPTERELSRQSTVAVISVPTTISAMLLLVLVCVWFFFWKKRQHRKSGSPDLVSTDNTRDSSTVSKQLNETSPNSPGVLAEKRAIVELSAESKPTELESPVIPMELPVTRAELPS